MLDHLCCAEILILLPCGFCGSKELRRTARCAACADSTAPRAPPWAAVFWVAIAIPVEVGLHLGLSPILRFSAHVTVPVLLLGCLFVSRAVRLSVMWTPLLGVLPV